MDTNKEAIYEAASVAGQQAHDAYLTQFSAQHDSATAAESSAALMAGAAARGVLERLGAWDDDEEFIIPDHRY